MRTLLSFFRGISLCITDSEVRRYAIRPWLIGLATSAVLTLVACSLHDNIRHYFLAPGEGWWHSMAAVGVWLLVTLGLGLTVVISSFVLVIVFASIFQTSLAKVILERGTIALPPEPTGVSGMAKDVGRTAVTETAKLVVLIPLILLATLIGFVPFLAPIALLVGAWLLGFQLYDVVLDTLRLTARERIRFARRFGWDVALLGGLTMAVGCIPFAGVLILPCAVAAAALTLSENEAMRADAQPQDTRSS